MSKPDKTKTETTKTTNTDAKRRVQEISIDQLEDVIGGVEEAAYPLRMAADEGAAV
ncbi:MAG TPA: hypothetical protein VL326_13600 [Kofleriaceae bacterium]|jgi:hypothetical protein|nr:hypothetical protein [Kofleriaceae bacterium]